MQWYLVTNIGYLVERTDVPYLPLIPCDKGAIKYYVSNF